MPCALSQDESGVTIRWRGGWKGLQLPFTTLTSTCRGVDGDREAVVPLPRLLAPRACEGFPEDTEQGIWM